MDVESPESKPTLKTLPPEILLYIFTFLDLPDLTQLSLISKTFANIASDPALHRLRLLVVAPSRIDHFLCTIGGELRVPVGELINRGLMRGLQIERRWRHGLYLYSPQAVKLYWNIQRLTRAHAGHSISTMLVSRASEPPQGSQTARIILPDVDSGSRRISRVLLPIVHTLKWSFQRDRLSQIYRKKSNKSTVAWFEGNAHLCPENERVRLAICPGVRKLKMFFERVDL
ncbi:hypothetical protein M422DRAFT_154965 [Sphaerobolus stellatus SS14]|nr:hypothetical protein M422DRAFT_154965 [Sphaerobolus stellatus SS14]